MAMDKNESNLDLNIKNIEIDYRAQDKKGRYIIFFAVILSTSLHIAFPYAQDIRFEFEPPETRSIVEFIALPDLKNDPLAEIDEKIEKVNDAEELDIENINTEVANQQPPLEQLAKKPKKIKEKPKKIKNKNSEKYNSKKTKITNKHQSDKSVVVKKEHVETARERRNREWLEARKTAKLAKIKGRKEFLRRKAKKNKVYKAPPASMKRGGSPKDAWVCEANSKGFKAQIKAEKGIKKWISFATAVLATYPTKPSLGKHFSRVTYVRKRKKEYIGSLGPREFIMPKGTIEIELESPRNGRLVLARKDVRCLVGVKYIRKKLFPITLYRVPAQFYLGSRKVSEALINLKLERNGSYKVTSYNSSHRILSNFRNGKLKNHKLIHNNINLHFFAAEAALGIGKLFGLDLRLNKKKK